MDNQEYSALRKRVRDLRTVAKTEGRDDVPPGIRLLRERLQRATNDEDYVALAGLLHSEYAFFGMPDEQERLLSEEIRRFPDQPVPKIALADFLASVRDDLKQALTVAETAVETAFANGNFVRDAYNCRARVAAKAKNYELLEDTLRKLTEYRPSADSKNVRHETDFLSDLPPNAVNADVLRKYLRSRKREK